jgi:FkbM family methyltransferase
MNMYLFMLRLRKLLLILRSHRFLIALLQHHVLAGVEHQVALSPRLQFVVDIGANRGQFALAARHQVPAAKVIAFEPLPDAASKFQRLFRGDPSVRLHQVAIGPHSGDATIHVSRHDDSSSLLAFSPLQEHFFPGTEEVRTDMVRMGRLSEFLSAREISSPALLKLDVQGFELQALQGCENLLHRFSQIYVECSFAELYLGQCLAHEVIAWLSERDFQLSAVYNVVFDNRGCAIQFDSLFTRKE